jgi:hypothetical protein
MAIKRAQYKNIQQEHQQLKQQKQTQKNTL